MSRIASFFAAVIFAVQSLFGIGGMAFGRVTIVSGVDVYPVGTQTVYTTVYNATWKSLSYGRFYDLQKQEGGAWVLVKPKEPMCFPEDMLVLKPFSSQSHFYDLSYYDTLQAGHYRIAAGYGAFEFDLVPVNCGTDTIILVLERDTYPLGTETIEGTLYNYTNEQIIVFPYGYSLERLAFGEWVDVPLKDSVEIPDANYPLPPHQSGHKLFRLTDHEGVTAGKYRIRAAGSAYVWFTLVDENSVTLTPEFDTYPVGTNKIKATLYNGSADVFSYTTGYRIDKWDGGKWVAVGPNLMFTMEMNDLLPGRSKVFTCDLSACDPPPDAGRYRIVVGGSVCGEFELQELELKIIVCY